MIKEASYYKYENNQIRCILCPVFCLLSEGDTGKCMARKVIDNKLYTLNYGEISSLALDPVEKKPLSMYKPGSMILSAGTFGCNFKCSYCQNYTISQARPHTGYVSPKDFVEQALKLKNHDNIGIAFTYNEPSIWFEYVIDTAAAAKENNLDVVLVTNGYINKNPLLDIIKYVDAVNIDVKAFTEDFYNDLCEGSLKPVMRTVKTAVLKCHVEITYLLIQGKNDSYEQVDGMSKWLGGISDSIPLHITRFYPMYKAKTFLPSDIKSIEKAKAVAKKYLKNVF